MKINQMLILRITLVLVLIVLAGYSALPMIPPKAEGIDVSATHFSAGRAMNDLEVVAHAPHSTGTPAQAAVRDYILSQVNLSGLSAEVQARGGISNILVHLPGTDPTLAVLVTGHYDSVSSSPGAGDDGVSTVAMLESIRVLQANPPLRNDVLFLFTDGEELGWVGAKAFIKEYPGSQAGHRCGAGLRCAPWQCPSVDVRDYTRRWLADPADDGYSPEGVGWFMEQPRGTDGNEY